MKYVFQIETTERIDFPAWQPVAQSDAPEEHEGTAASYGREVLDSWLLDNSDWVIPTNEDGAALYRIQVEFGDDPEPFSGVYPLVTLDCTQLEEPSPELAALEAAREQKRRVQTLDILADMALTQALQAANEAGHSANSLAKLVYPAVSRPVALRMMGAPDDHKQRVAEAAIRAGRISAGLMERLAEIGD